MPKLGSITKSSFTVHKQSRSGSATGWAVESRNGSTPGISIELPPQLSTWPTSATNSSDLGVQLDGSPGIPGGVETVTPGQGRRVRGVGGTERRDVADRPRRELLGLAVEEPLAGRLDRTGLPGEASGAGAASAGLERRVGRSSPSRRWRRAARRLFWKLEKTTSPLMSVGQVPGHDLELEVGVWRGRERSRSRHGSPPSALMALLPCEQCSPT